MMIRAPGRSRGSDVETLDFSNRLYKSLLKDGLVPPQGRPIDEEGSHISSDPSLTEEGLEGRLAARSHAKWLDFTRRYGMAAWMEKPFLELVQDCFMYPPEHVRARQKVRDALKHGRYRTRDQWKALKVREEKLKLKQGALTTGMYFFRTSPALFAALATRSGQIMGSYCDCKHKSGRAKELYEQLRKAAAS